MVRGTAARPQADASMRPQHITAENRFGGGGAKRAPRSFNEAAAYHCGKLSPAVIFFTDGSASMRPQHITAENGWGWTWTAPTPSCFNEAAAYHCGKRTISDACGRE